MGFRRFVLALAVACISAMPLSAAEVYLVQGTALGHDIRHLGNLLDSVFWSSDVLFYNDGELEKTIRLLGISNGGVGAISDDEFVIPPGRTASLRRMTAWRPKTPTPLWVVRLQAPPEVVLENLLFIGATRISTPPAASDSTLFGKVRLPVVRSLTPANERQIHLGTSFFYDHESRINVSIYNRAPVTATGVIEVRDACEGAVVVERLVSIPPDTIQQFLGIEISHPPCFAPGGNRTLGPLHAGTLYTVVTVDQPSFSFVTNISNQEIPITSITVTTPD